MRGGNNARAAIAIAILMLAACASRVPPPPPHERPAYDDAARGEYPAAETALAKHRAGLMEIPGVSLIYVANDGHIVIRVKKQTPELDDELPSQLDNIPVRVVSVQHVLERHLHELIEIAGNDNLYSSDVESFPDGQLAIVIRVRNPSWEQDIEVPTDIEGIPLRVLVAQDPLVS